MVDEREVRHCDRCGTPFSPVRELQRFCSKDCHDQFYMEERRRALAHWREMQRQKIFGYRSTSSLEDEEIQPEKRRA